MRGRYSRALLPPLETSLWFPSVRVSSKKVGNVRALFIQNKKKLPQHDSPEADQGEGKEKRKRRGERAKKEGKDGEGSDGVDPRIKVSL